MNKKYINSIIVTMLSVVLMTSCTLKEEVVTVKNSGDAIVKDKAIEELLSKNKILKNDLEVKNVEILDYEKEIGKIKMELDKQSQELSNYRLDKEETEKDKVSTQEVLNKKIEFIHKNSAGDKLELIPIYNFNNVDDYHDSEIDDWIISGSFDTIESKLIKIVEEINKRYFPKSEMEFVKIQEMGDSKVAVINFLEKNGGYFDGSAIGAMSDNKIKYNILQPKYYGDWVDGIRVTAGEERFLTDHTSLWTDVYKDEIKVESKIQLNDLIGEVGKKYLYSGDTDNKGMIREVRRYEDGELDVFISAENDSSRRYKIEGNVMYKVFSNKGDNWEGNGFVDGDIVIKGPVVLGSTWVKDSYISMVTDIKRHFYTGKNSYDDVVVITKLYQNGDFEKEYYAKGIGMIMINGSRENYKLESIESIKK